MSSILFLCHRFPYPPNKGDKIRSFHILRHFIQKNDVYLGTLIDEPMDWQFVPKIEKLVTDLCVVERRRIRKHWPLCVKGLVQGKSITNILFFAPQLKLWIDSLLKTNKISKIFVFSSTMAQYVLEYQDRYTIITDFVDVDSQKWIQYAQTKWFPFDMLYRIEGKRLKNHEKVVSNASAASILVSEQESKLFKKNVNAKGRILSVPNGVDTEYFNSNLKYSNPFQGEAKRIIFTGLMNYWPNVDAVAWFAKEVFQKIRPGDPSVEFYICGANPTKAVFSLSDSRIMVTGRVPDIRPYLYHADIVVVPLRIARGIQNKVLEAMSMAKPIIASRAALEGIDCGEVKSVWEEDSVRAWIDRIEHLLDYPPKTIKSNEWVKQHYSWSAHLNSLDHLVSEDSSEELNQVIHL